MMSWFLGRARDPLRDDLEAFVLHRVRFSLDSLLVNHWRQFEEIGRTRPWNIRPPVGRAQSVTFDANVDRPNNAQT